MLSRRPSAPPRPPACAGAAVLAWIGLLSATALVTIGAQARSGSRARSITAPAARRSALVVAREPIAPVTETAGPSSPVSTAAAPEMPSLLVGPPAPERLAANTSHHPRGPNWHLPPLPAIPRGGAPLTNLMPLPPAGPAVPVAIIPRQPGVPVPLVPGTPGETAARPARAAETTPSNPLSLRLSLTPAQSSLQGPGDWLKVRASASVPCYLVVFHVNADHRATTVFPRRFDVQYEPNVTYNLLTRAQPGETGEVVVAIASVYPLTAADALAAVEASRAVAPVSARGPLSRELWDAIEGVLRGRASGPSSLAKWEPHAWKVAIATHRPSPPPEAAPGDTGAPPSGAPGSTGGATSAPAGRTSAPATPAAPAAPSGQGPAGAGAPSRQSAEE